jgi:UDP-2,3-diacylglucosamine hydrolase
VNPDKKIYFASDVHLGAPALKFNKERELLFVDWLKRISQDASMIFLLGDIFDFWFEYKKVAPRGFVRLLGTLAEICDSGIPVHFFIGNHDIWVFDYLPKETGVIVHRKHFITELNGKKFFLSHGDDPGRKDKGYQLLQGLFRNRFAQWAFAKIHPDLAFRLAHYWSKHSRLYKGVNGAGFLGEDKEDQIIFARDVLSKEHFDFFVFGHRHLALDFQLAQNSRLILLGEWFREFSYGVLECDQFYIEKINAETLKKFRITI